MGGIHRFMTWDRSVLTDSGGYQIFSLPHSRSITEAGAVFQSYIDGKSILLSPEVSIQTQLAIGSDIMMVLDQCVPSTADRATARAAPDLTHEWAGQSLEARGESAAALFGIVQGALFPDLRRQSVDHLAQMAFDGLAIGGLALGGAAVGGAAIGGGAAGYYACGGGAVGQHVVDATHRDPEAEEFFRQYGLSRLCQSR